jgi:hypothetical protein
MADFSEHLNESAASIKCGDCFVYKLLMKASTIRSYISD